MGCNCCCNADQVRDGCSDTGAFIPNFCCKCVPRRVCVSLYSPDDLYTPISSVQASWCDLNGLASREYSGDLVYNSSNIDFKISFYKDSYDHCYIYLESESMGYVDDNIQYLPMGGTYFDAEIKRSECTSMNFSWDVEIYGSPFILTIEPADNVIQPKRKNPIYCIYRRACITYYDGYEETTVYACMDSYYQWSVNIDDDPNKNITISLESDIADVQDYVVLSLSSFLGNGENTEANCPKMYAKWNFDNGTWIKIIGDNQAKCVDCKYHCRCLCVTYTNGIDSIQRKSTCVDNGYDGCDTVWTVDINDQVFTFTLACIGCEILTTVIQIEGPPELTLIGSPQRSIICPDQLSASWSFNTGGSNVVTIEIECVGCDSQCSVDDIAEVVPCCPDRTTGIPATLYATIESSTDCPQLDGQVITLLKQVPFQAELACWEGSITVTLFGNPCIQQFALMCTSSDGETNVWRLVQSTCGTFSSSSNTMTLISCDPLELLITITGVGCCEGSVGATITVRITE